VESRLDDKKVDHPQLVTLHVINPPKKKCMCLFTAPETFQPKILIKELYGKFLREDPLFHFLFEPDLIIRISNNKVLNEIKGFLEQADIDFDIYDYPLPVPNAAKRRFGENEGGPIIEKLYDVYLPLFHLNAIAALTMNEDEQGVYIERANHTFYNMLGNSRQEEADKLLLLAIRKSEKPLASPVQLPVRILK
jgi:hypothetical protein